MNRKILAVDMDDTLFDDNKDICKENIDALNRMLDEGHILAVDTGRPTHVLKKLLEPFAVFDRENVYLLGYQGSTGHRSIDSQEIFGSYLDHDGAMKLLNYAVSIGHSCIAFEENKIYTFRQDDNVARYAAIAKEPVEVLGSPKELEGKNLIKIMVVDFDDPDSLFDFQAEHEQELSQYFISMFSNVAFLEYVGKDSSKGQGLIKLAKYLDIPMENTVACGDERNDISMIEAAGVGVAVSNARDELKAHANYITEKNNNEGAVAEAIYKFILN